MKKVYCFYCQKDVEPQRRLLWLFCRQCNHRLTDNGEGFYRVCANCGANMPADGDYCVKCGYNLSNGPDKRINWPVLIMKYGWIINVLASVLLILIFAGLIYISFYVFIFLALFIAVSFVFSMFRRG